MFFNSLEDARQKSVAFSHQTSHLHNHYDCAMFPDPQYGMLPWELVAQKCVSTMYVSITATRKISHSCCRLVCYKYVAQVKLPSAANN